MKYPFLKEENRILKQWEKLTGRPVNSESAKLECFACYHESRAALILAALKKKSTAKASV